MTFVTDFHKTRKFPPFGSKPPFLLFAHIWLNLRAYRKSIRTIVAIVKLAVIGIPVHEAERSMPWPNPQFVPQPSTRSAANIEFEVNLFQSEFAECIVPFDLYTWRLTKLEEAINKAASGIVGLNVIKYFDNPQKVEDSKAEPFSCTKCNSYG